MISSNGNALLYLLSLERTEILRVINPINQRGVYFDRDSEDEGTPYIELSLIKVSADALNYFEEIPEEINLQVKEMCWLMSLVHHLGVSGYMSCSLSADHPHNLFWEVVNRYSLQLCNQLGIDSGSLNGFKFEDVLLRYGHSFKKLTEKEWFDFLKKKMDGD